MLSTSRQTNFVRATVIDYSCDTGILLRNVSNLLVDIEKSKSSLSKQEQLAAIEELYLAIMDVPEILCHYPKFRTVAIEKAKECNSNLHSLRHGKSMVLSDFMYYCEMIKIRPDYMRLEDDYPTIVERVKTHNYNLRSRTTSS